jgi:hypothetical protein
MPELNDLANANAELTNVVDDLSKPENEAALNKALTDELKTQEGDTPADKTPEASPKPEGNKEKTLSDDNKQPEKADKIKNLLSSRNEARDAAAKAELDAQAKEQRIKDLEAENERLKSGNKGEGDDNQPSADDKPLTKAEVEKLLAERESSEIKKAAAEKADVAEVDALKENKSTPNSEEYRDDILEIMKKHPTLSAYAAYKMLQGDGIIPFDDASASSNASKLNTGDKTKANLLKDKKPEDMSDAELEAAARDVAAQGLV